MVLTKTERDRVLLVLQGARDLLSNPKCWSKGAVARDGKGRNVGDPFDERTTAWDVMSACDVIAYNQGWKTQLAADTAGEARMALHEALGDLLSSLLTFQDDKKTTHKQLMDLFDKAVGSLDK